MSLIGSGSKETALVNKRIPTRNKIQMQLIVGKNVMLNW